MPQSLVYGNVCECRKDDGWGVGLNCSPGAEGIQPYGIHEFPPEGDAILLGLDPYTLARRGDFYVLKKLGQFIRPLRHRAFQQIQDDCAVR